MMKSAMKEIKLGDLVKVKGRVAASATGGQGGLSGK